MSILKKCEEIGVELRHTPEGKRALEYFTAIKGNPEEFKGEFFNLINKDYVRIHFYAVPSAVDIIENNIENKVVGPIMKRLLAIDNIKEFGESNIPIGKFVDRLSVMSFNNSVKYELPSEVTATPALIRLSNALTVECQRISLVQSFIKEYHTDPHFSEAVKRFDEIKGEKPILPYSKEDRVILHTIRKEYPDVKVNLLYSLISVMSYIKCMIFDSFYGNIFEVFEAEDVILRNQKVLNGCSFVKLVLVPNERTLGAHTGWILKLNNRDGTISYGQIFNKKMKWTKEETKVTIKALIHDAL